MIHCVVGKNPEAVSFYVEELIRGQFADAQVIRFDEDTQLDRIATDLVAPSLFGDRKVLVVELSKLSKQQFDLLKNLANEVDIIIQAGARDCRKQFEGANFQLHKADLSFSQIIRTLKQELPGLSEDTYRTLVDLARVEVEDKLVYSPYRLRNILKWGKLFAPLTDEKVKKYIVANLDYARSKWEALDRLFSKDKRSALEYFQDLMSNQNPHEFLASIRGQLLTLAKVRYLEQKGFSQSQIVKFLNKNPYYIERLLQIKVEPKRVLRLVESLFSLDYKARTGAFDDIVEGFLTIVASLGSTARMDRS